MHAHMREGTPARTPADAVVRGLAQSVAALGFHVSWATRSTGAALDSVSDGADHSTLTLQLAHPGWAAAVYLDFLSCCGRVVVAGACGARRARTDVDAAAPPPAVARRVAAHVLRPLRGDDVAEVSLAGLPTTLSARLFEWLGARAACRVAATGRAPRAAATRDALWRAFYARDFSDALPVPTEAVMAQYAARAVAARARAAHRDAYRSFVDWDIRRRWDDRDPLRITPFGPAPPLQPPAHPEFDTPFRPRGPSWAPAWAFGGRGAPSLGQRDTYRGIRRL
jgi:hypothetical protein